MLSRYIGAVPLLQGWPGQGTMVLPCCCNLLQCGLYRQTQKLSCVMEVLHGNERTCNKYSHASCMSLIKFDAHEIYLPLMNTMLVKYACWMLLTIDHQCKQTPGIISACCSPCQLRQALCTESCKRLVSCSARGIEQTGTKTN